VQARKRFPVAIESSTAAVEQARSSWYCSPRTWLMRRMTRLSGTPTSTSVCEASMTPTRTPRHDSDAPRR